MKKLTIILLVLLIACLQLNAKPMRLKFGITDYSSQLQDFDFSSGIYRIHGRFDLLSLSSRLGVGTNLNITYKSDNNEVDLYNYYDFYLHNFTSSSTIEGTYMMYGITAGMRTTRLRYVTDGYHGKATYTFSRFFCSALVTRNYWGMELTASLNENNKLKFDISTKYQFQGKYYLELAYSMRGPVKELKDEVSVTFGLELFKP